MTARFITLEGAEGCGKSTQARLLVAALETRGIPVLLTREPGGTVLGERLRELLLAQSERPMQAMTELLLMLAARAEHLSTVIRPALAAGRWVICDRYADASMAYQGAGRGLPVATIEGLHSLALGPWRPDRSLFFETDAAVRAARLHERGTSDRFEAEAAEFHQRVAQGYRDQARREPERIRLVDGNGVLESVQHRVMDALGDLMPTGPRS